MSKHKTRNAIHEARTDEAIKSGNVSEAVAFEAAIASNGQAKRKHVTTWNVKANILRVDNVGVKPYDGDEYFNQKTGKTDIRQIFCTVEFDMTDVTETDRFDLIAASLVIKAQTPMRKVGMAFLNEHKLIRVNGKQAGRNLPMSPLVVANRAAKLMSTDERAEHRAELDELDAIEAAENE